MDIRLQTKFILCCLISSIILIIINLLGLNSDNIYKLYINNQEVECYGQIEELSIQCNEVKNSINDIIIDKEDKNDITYKKVKYDEVKGTDKDLRDSIISSINSEAVLTKVYLGDQYYGLVLNEQEGKEVLRRIGEIFIDESKIDRDKIISVDVKANLRYEKENERIRNVKPIEEIARNIIKSDKFNNLVFVDILCREERVDSIDVSTKVVNRDDMYLGEVYVEEGEEGIKSVVSNVVYRNGLKVNEEIIEQDIIKYSIDKVVYKGTKSPIKEDVAFLRMPTRGGYVTSNFGPRWGSTHSGMDIAGEIGDPVCSALDGKVKECRYDGSYGNKILIQHEDGIETIYGHLSKFEVKVGDEIKKGQLIGRVGSTGRSTGPHLHFEVRVNGSPVDPKKYLVN